MNLLDTLARARVIPVITIRDLDTAMPLARALVEGGLNVLEITLRTDAALGAISRIRQEIEGAIVGAGTVLSVRQLESAAKAGADFIVSPGLTIDLLQASCDHAAPLLPGVATPSDIMRAMSYGLSIFKLFPAGSLGGPNYIRALSGPFSQVRFCPTGGIILKDLSRYFALPSVVAVGGSWMIPPDLGSEGAYRLARRMAEEARGAAQERTKDA